MSNPLVSFTSSRAQLDHACHVRTSSARSDIVAPLPVFLGLSSHQQVVDVALWRASLRIGPEERLHFRNEMSLLMRPQELVAWEAKLLRLKSHSWRPRTRESKENSQ